MTQEEFDAAIAEITETNKYAESHEKALVLIAKLLFEQTRKLESMRLDINQIEVSVGQMRVY